MATKIPDPDDLKRLLRYCSESGELHWLERPGNGQFNKLFAGTRGFTAVDSSGYFHGTVRGRIYLAHRIIWLLVHGYWPDHIDHINGNRQDNRIANLREVGRRGNTRNVRRTDRNTTGTVGVHYRKDKTKNPWQARICVDGKHIHLGYFPTAEEAARARLSASRANGFHPNHGRG